ncbi:hypothetical protein BC938DRAFT_471397 [Jimgerdemannia flammicorona]|uniref:SAM domain-containing protein n=1 Tax=Jimgerdemannia flammicorona TaxID=994334 RepID=A0A433Q880_9FUNG|nr:hypothetical protein BC938DRAFT_471397 [Jimgerdemannia flammicorona]
MEFPELHKLNLSQQVDLLLKIDPTYKGWNRNDLFSHLKREGINTLREEQMAENTTTEGEHEASASAAQTHALGGEGEASVAAQQPLTTDEIKKWNTDQVIQHLTEKFPGKFSEAALNILRNEEIEGRAFLKLTKGDLMADGMKRGPASIIDDYVKELNGMYH